MSEKSAEKKLIIKEETPLGYFQPIIDFVYDPNYARYLRRLSERYDRSVIPEDINLMPFIIDALIFETYIQNKTPLEHFMLHFKSQMTKTQFQIYQKFRQSHLSCFVVLDRLLPETLVFKDLLDNEVYQIRDSEALKFLFKETLTITRLLPYQNHFVLSGACTILNFREPDTALDILKAIKLPPLKV